MKRSTAELEFVRLGEPPFAHPYDIQGLCYSTDGNELAVSGGQEIRIWNLEEAKTTLILPGGGPVWFTGMHGLVLSGPGKSRSTSLRDLAHGNVLFETEDYTAIAMTTDKRLIATGEYQKIRLFSEALKQELASIDDAHEGMIETLAFSPDGKLLASGGVHTGGTKDVHLWQVEQAGLKLIRSMHLETGRADGIKFSPDGSKVVIGSRSLYIWDVAGGESKMHEIAGGQSSLLSIAFSPNGSLLAGGDQEGTVRVWNTTDWVEKFRIMPNGEDEWVRAVAFSPDGKTLATAGSKARVSIIDLESGAEISVALGHSDAVLNFAKVGDRLFSIGMNGEVRLWEINSGEQIELFDRRNHRGLAVSPNGHQVAIGCDDGLVEILDCHTLDTIQTLPGHEKSVTSVCWVKDETSLATGSWDGTIRIWDTESGTATLVVHAVEEPGEDEGVVAIAMPPDGNELASLNMFEPCANFWNPYTGEPSDSVGTFDYTPTSIAYSPDGKLFAVSSREDNQVIVHETGSLKELHSFEHESNSVTFSPDSKMLASGGADGSVVLWNLISGKQAQTFKTGGGQVFALIFFSNQQLVAGTELGRIIGWNLE